MKRYIRFATEQIIHIFKCVEHLVRFNGETGIRWRQIWNRKKMMFFL